MASPDCQVLTDALVWHDANHAVKLVTVVSTWGSSPRPPGAMLAIREDGMVSGSVSGGCVEDDLVDRARKAFRSAHVDQASDLPMLINYGVTQQEAARFGLPCGGTLCLVQESLSDTTWVRHLLDQCTHHQLVARTLNMANGEIQLTKAVQGQKLTFDNRFLTTLFGPQWRLLLIGAGQLSTLVAQMALILDFEVLVCDPRDEYAPIFRSRLPNIQLLNGMPDDVVRELSVDARTAVVALTHDPKLDDMALLEALKSKAFYVGALGSHINQQRRKQRLAEHFDISESELEQLHGPVGLRLGGKTPAEIAISILAEIIQVRNADASALERN
jgi:xanthine dehydrogenase accessory factor